MWSSAPTTPSGPATAPPSSTSPGGAADHCVALGAWRQAALLYGQALDHGGDHLPDADLDRLLEAAATTCLRVELIADAVATGERLLARLETRGDPERLAEWESWLSTAYRAVGRAEDSFATTARAVARAEPLGDTPALARALSNLSGHLLVSGQYDKCIEASQRAIALAERFELEDACVYALNSYGAALGCLGDAAGNDLLRESLDRAKRAGLAAHVSRAAANLGSGLIGDGQPAQAVPVYDDGIGVCEEHELRFQLNCLRPGRAEAFILLGDWDTAAADLNSVLVDPFASSINRAIVTFHLGRLRARRGDPGAIEALDEALTLSEPFEEAQLIAPAHIARAEAAWLTGDRADRRRARRGGAAVRAAARSLRLPRARAHRAAGGGRLGAPAVTSTSRPRRSWRATGGGWPRSGNGDDARTRWPTRWSTAPTSTTSAGPTSSSRRSGPAPAPRWRRGGCATWVPATCPAARGRAPGPTPPV